MRAARIGLAWLAVAASLAAASPCGAQQQRLSPPDSTKLNLAGRQLTIVYSSPSARGRVIYGGLVPWGRVWRTGANEATSFRTEANLRIGDAEVPAGDYTLYSIPNPDDWTLIVNRQTGQWGTEYHEDMDLDRVEMKIEELDEPSERFRITLEATGPDEGRLVMEWEKTRVSVPIKTLQ